MFKYVKHTNYPIDIKKKDLKMAKYLITQFGGANGKRDRCLKMKCKNFKVRHQKHVLYNYCTKLKRKIQYEDCKNCEFKEYKQYKPMRKSSNKRSKKETERFSIIYPDKDKCALCPNISDLTWHEIYRGRNRYNSIEYGLCLRLCINCHRLYQEDKNFNDYWHIRGQEIFNQYYPNLDFVKIFRINYL